MRKPFKSGTWTCSLPELQTGVRLSECAGVETSPPPKHGTKVLLYRDCAAELGFPPPSPNVRWSWDPGSGTVHLWGGILACFQGKVQHSTYELVWVRSNFVTLPLRILVCQHTTVQFPLGKVIGIKANTPLNALSVRWLEEIAYIDYSIRTVFCRTVLDSAPACRRVRCVYRTFGNSHYMLQCLKFS